MKQSATRYKQKAKLFLVIRPPTCWQFDSCFWFGRAKNERTNNEWKWTCNYCRNYSYNYFQKQIFLKFLVKFLPQCVFSQITGNTRPLIKQHPQQIPANYVHISWRALKLLWLFFEAFRISWSLLNFPNLTFQPTFCKSKVNKII